MQSQNNKFEDRFRQRANELKVQPDAHNWDRISGRLSAANGRSRMLSQNWIKVAAAVLLLAVLATAYLALPDGATNHQYASSPQELEVLPMSTEADVRQSESLLAYDEIYRRIVNYPIAEGASSRKLLPNK